MNSLESKPYSEIGLFSKLYFCWIWPLLIQARKKRLSASQIPPVPNANSCNVVGSRLIAYWENTAHKRSLWRLMLRVYWRDILLQGLLYFLVQIFQITRTLCLSYFLSSYTENPRSETTIILAGILILTSAATILTTNPWNFISSELGLNMCTSLTALIYHKALRLSAHFLSQTDAGALINLISNDAKRLETRVTILHALWTGPLVTVVIIVILIKFYHPASAAGLLALAIIPSSSYTGVRASRVLAKVSFFRDIRLKLIGESISNVKEIKMNCWENVFENKVEKMRGNEIKSLRHRWMMWGIYRNTYITTPCLVVFIAILITLISAGSLDPATVFVVMCFYNIVSSLMSQAFPSAVFLVTEINVSFKRCLDFLLLEERDSSTGRGLYQGSSTTSPDKRAVEVRNYSGCMPGNTNPVLESIHLTCNPGQLLCILGPTGSGKSSLLTAILGNLVTVSGSILVRGSVAWVSPSPWIFPATLRDNITFGFPFEMRRYLEVLACCALTQDLLTFPLRDQEVLSDRGFSVSGGQAARISLARAVYSNADIYLLDNVLSSVDVAVGRHILTNVVFGLLKSKAVIMVTNPMRELDNEQSIYLKDGRIFDAGTCKELLQRHPDLFNHSKIHVHDEKKFISRGSEDPDTERITERKSSIGYGTFEANAEQLTPYTDKEVEKGVVGLYFFVKYIASTVRIPKIIFLAIVLILFQVLQSATDMMLIVWTNASADGFTRKSRFFSVIYSMLIVADMLMGGLGLTLFYRMCTSAAKKLHQMAFRSILHTKLAFFASNTIGSILNRFSMDMGSIEEYLPKVAEAAISSVLQVLGIFGVAVVLNPVLAIPAAFIAILFVLLRGIYLEPSSDLRRIEAEVRSPVYTHVTTTLEGIGTIQTLRRETDFRQRLYEHKDKHTATYFTYLAVFNWFIFWLDFLVFLFCLVTIAAFLAFPKDPAAMGLTISLIFSADNIFSYGMQQTAELGNELVSVKRMLEYTALRPEQAQISNLGLRNSWTLFLGAIEFRDVSASYGSGALTLRNISCKFVGGEKVGIVGRTGAGKSSLFNCLLRLVDIVHGSIWIDGTNINTLSLSQLRSAISVISQSPFLIEGTLRSNLDIQNEYSDSNLMEALAAVQMLQRLASSGLQSPIKRGGSNFSHGERQLLCLARALLRKSKILLLDEATAKVDQVTEEVIQNVIKTKFRGSTVLAIAHHLETVLRFDKLLVLDDGRIVEFGPPKSLLADPESKLRKLIGSNSSGLNHEGAKKKPEEPVKPDFN